MSELNTRAQEICAHLLMFPYLTRDKYRDLMLDEELREDVQRRLEGVGMTLAESFYSEHYSVRPHDHIEADIRFDWASNQRIPKGALAMLVVLWTKLVLPRRAATDHRVNPGDDNLPLFEQEEARPTQWFVKVAKEAIMAEFQDRFGRTNLLRYLGQLKRLGFIREDRSGRIYEGPLLDLLVDGNKLAEDIQAGVLGDILGEEAPLEAACDDEPLFDLTTVEDPD